ncbi:MAG: DUF3127 domain-containing protein, partial [Clostridium sp.]|nr:DUF3127 domain-containing protein [Clostridium sp.]
MDLEGKIIRKLNVQTGNSARGSWAKQEFVLEYQDGNYPAQACLNVWGEDKVKDLEKYQVGDNVRVAFNINSREYNGRWYNDLRAWRIEPAGVSQPKPAYTGSHGAQQVPPAAPMPTAADMPDF